MREFLMQDLKRVVAKQDWKSALIDVDDTVCASSKHWLEGYTLIAEGVSRLSGYNNITEILDFITSTDDSLFTAFGVHPRKYAIISEKIYPKYLLDKAKTLEIVKEGVKYIYLGTPKLFPETLPTFSALSEAGLHISLVSHSPAGRIKNVMKSWDFENRYPYFYQTTLKPKGPDLWRTAIDKSGKEALIIGDNLKGDILAGLEGGAKNAVWIKPKWKMYAEGTLPAHVPIINSIGELVETLITTFS